jgi:hypothetical protein
MIDSRVSTNRLSVDAKAKQLHTVINGVMLGRKPMLTRHQQQEAIKSLNAGNETQGEIARSYNVSRWTIARLT